MISTLLPVLITCLFLCVNADPGNPYLGRDVYRFPDYVNEATKGALAITNTTLSAKALKVADVPNFLWIDSISKISAFEAALARASSISSTGQGPPIVQVVLYNLPGRDCANPYPIAGDFASGSAGVEGYKTKFVDVIVGIAKKYPTVPVVATSVTYALQQLNTANIVIYIDSANEATISWPAGYLPAASLLASLYKNAGSPKSVRGVALNIGAYDYLDPYYSTNPNPNASGSTFIQVFSTALASQSFPLHFIVDQSRSGRGGKWLTCNLRTAGIGLRPTTSTPDSTIDAIVWANRVGESDGSSWDKNAGCGGGDSFPLSPEAGEWFQTYFVSLVTNANPEL